METRTSTQVLVTMFNIEEDFVSDLWTLGSLNGLCAKKCRNGHGNEASQDATKEHVDERGKKYVVWLQLSANLTRDVALSPTWSIDRHHIHFVRKWLPKMSVSLCPVCANGRGSLACRVASPQWPLRRPRLDFLPLTHPSVSLTLLPPCGAHHQQQRV